ncbi:ABC-type organic anion transporter ABCA8-like isoform X1 [Sorex fumeus]|uniref:ABC-type organic anion transporter ABCA8-like isoform X1 n=2 Tax=Sorex fumeus TaxID=62283 RepID=UPI0024AD49C3|nr:ABC-type organic anion transporter ABCA8-like isoform X1 [Sorex fumeus]
MNKKEISMCRQTWALLCKNLLKIWRMKREHLMEWLNALLLLFCIYIHSMSHFIEDFSSLPVLDLGRVDSFRDSTLTIAYTPVTNTTQQIMDKVASASFMKDNKILGHPNEESIEEFSEAHMKEVIRVIFTNTFHYHLKFLVGYRIPTKKEHSDHTAHCYKTVESVDCGVSEFWNKGFISLQAAINAAIIEITTNHSVMEQLMSITGKTMKLHSFISQDGIMTDIFIFLCIICFSPFTYYVSQNVARERKKLKGFMTMMGLQDSAFWYSWGLLYAGFIFIMALLIALLIKSVQFVILTGFLVVFIHFFLYGLSLIALSFLMSVLVKKSFLTALVVFLLTVFCGTLGFTALYRHLPAALEWILSLLSPFAFTLGMAQLLHLDYDLNSNVFPDPPDTSHLIIATDFMLIFDIFLYLVLTMYFEKILPNEFGHRYPPLFFLKSSFWSQQKAEHVVLEDEIDSEPFSNDSFEPMSPEFNGKEAIRIRNVTKEYKGKPNKIEALKGLVFDIYEGQITAILGHSGAGKSTLLNILSGLSIPTKGSVTIYNDKVSETNGLGAVSKLIGVCPQSNVQFDFLTVRENLRLFAKIKGIPPHDVEQEIQRVMLQLEMKNIQNVLAKNLSGGQKRKLTFGIAILGDPQIFLLDEPTAGLDPFSRHQVWNFLRERKTDHVVVFSTQFMDEADILADRKVFLSKGRLKCAGSSLFLKKKWGIGYHLSLQLNEMSSPAKITSLVKQHIPDAKLSSKSEGKLVYTLPLERTNRFPELYKNLDSCSDLGIENYDVSMRSLTEVFLKLEGKSVIDESEMVVLGDVQSEQATNTESLTEMAQVLSSLNKMRRMKSGMALWTQQVYAIARVRFLKIKHECKNLLSLLLILGVAIFPLLLEYILVKINQNSYTWELSPHLYFLASGQQPHDPLTPLLIINKTGTSINDFIHSVEQQNINLEVDILGTKNGLDDLSYNGAIIVSGNEQNYSFSLACNTKRLNCFPVLMDIVSNGLLQMANSSDHIQTDRSTFYEDDQVFPYKMVGKTMCWLLLASCCAPYIAMSSIDDYKNKIRSQLRISGLFPSAYWFGQALVDIPMYFSMFLFMYLMDLGFYYDDDTFRFVNSIMQIICTIGYSSSLIFLTYGISFIFRKGRKNSGFWSFCFFIVTLFSAAIIVAQNNENALVYSLTFFIPPVTLIGYLFLSYYHFIPDIFDVSRAEPSPIFLFSFFHCIIFVFILQCLEWKFGKKPMRKDPLFRISPRSSDWCPNPEEPEGEDEDVQRERVRTVNALNSTDLEEKPVIIASCLRKEYARKRKHCFSKSKKKLAARNVSFCVRKGEVLGLLGHNGAGKSTSISVITGDTNPTAGQVILKGGSGEAPLEFLGYCPQENVLWPNLTVKEHLEVFAAVKGLSKKDAAISIPQLVDAFKLQDQLKLPVKNLSEGIKRKLCFVLSILGSPSVMLLDEPSTGMDPEGQLQIWEAIRATIRNTERSALLTTHYMAEAEAVCDRVAIMVSGRIRCIGSIQHLKSKFGKDYLLEMKVRTPEQGETLHEEILRLFPQAARQERYSSLMVYKLPVEDVKPLAQAFLKLETVKQSFDLEEYSLSQSTLEQVFLELSKEQELNDLDEEIHPSMRWKLLPKEEL